MSKPVPEPTFKDWEAGLTQREQRIREVVGMMSRGAWLSGVTDELLAKKWNCDPSNVRHIAAEANRTIRLRLRDDPAAQQEARAMLLQNIDVIRAKATGNGDAQSLRVALDAMRAYGFYLGIEPAKKLDIGRREDPFEGWTTDEKLAFSRDGSRPRRALGNVLSEPVASSPQRASSNGNGAGRHASAEPDDEPSDGSVH